MSAKKTVFPTAVQYQKEKFDPSLKLQRLKIRLKVYPHTLFLLLHLQSTRGNHLQPLLKRPTSQQAPISIGDSQVLIPLTLPMVP